MNSPSVGSRPAAFDIVVIVALWIGTYIAAKILSGYLPAPEGDIWRWACAAVAAVAAFFFVLKFRLSIVAWMLIFSGTYLTCQGIVQLLFAYGILRF